MKDLNDLLQQFDDIQELPVSEETVGAYVEGNLAGSELRDIQNLINSDEIFAQSVNAIGDIDKSMLDVISPPQLGVEAPTTLGINPMEQDISLSTAPMDNIDFTFHNGESLFDIDFGSFEVSQSHDHHHDNNHHDINDDVTNHSLNDFF